MIEKIEWYKEVLALEPGSKVFFPLARALAESGEKDTAVEVLKRGVELHPEFLEARIFMVQLLHDNGTEDDCRAELGRLTELFAEYPGFWTAWSAARSEQNPDLGLVLRYVAATLRRPDLSLRQLLESALEGVRTDGPATATVQGGPFPCTPACGDESVGSPFSPESGANISVSDMSVAAASSSKGTSAKTNSVEEATVCTRSMAEVLAEQGDIAGALEIYHELAAAASGPEEQEELRLRMAALEAKVGEVRQEEARARQAPQSEKAGLRTILENLAERLEARAR